MFSLESPTWAGRTGIEDGLTAAWLEGLVARVAHHYRLSQDDVPDLVQETRIALWEVGSKVTLSPSLVARVAQHKAVDLVRRLVRDRRRDRTIEHFPRVLDEDAELGHLLNVRIAGLPKRLQELFDLHYRQGFSEREIARRWRVSRSSVRWLDHQCRELITRTREGPPARNRKAACR